MISRVLVFNCLSLMLPTIYAAALGPMAEEEAKLGSANLIMAIVGGALPMKLQGGLINFILVDGRSLPCRRDLRPVDLHEVQERIEGGLTIGETP